MFFKTNLYKKYRKEIGQIKENKEKYLKLYKEDEKAYESLEVKEKTEILGYAASGISLHMGLEVRDEQYIAVLSLIDGKLIEMSTGEGKTIVGYLFGFHEFILEKQAFIVTVNDYLVERDATGLQTLLRLMGRNAERVKFITQETSHSLRLMYYERANVIYISSQQLMFDNLKNKMVTNTQDYYNIKFESILLDEADLILLDESQNPFIIAGEDDSTDKEIHEVVEFVRTKLKPYLEIKKEEKEINITEEGYEFLEANGYDILDYKTLGKINNSMKALFLFTKNVDYVIQKDKIMLIDAYTGRILDGRRLQDGLHQFLEAKENVSIQNENRTIRSMTYPHFFAKFKEFVGMSGTLTESKDELKSIYGLNIEVIPTHKESQLTYHQDKLYATKEEKLKGLVEFVKEKKPQPILIVTTNIKDTFLIEKELKKSNIDSQTLNAYNEETESLIIAKAGGFDTLTIATNMAGRGTDINVDKESLAAGGLVCIGFEHNNTSRIDRQLVGRTARAGNPGEAVFLTSLEDEWIPLMNEDYREVVQNAKNNEKKLRKLLKQKNTINDGFYKQFREQENRLQTLYGIHRDLLYLCRDEVLFARTFNDLVSVVNDFLYEGQEVIFKSEKDFESTYLKYMLIQKFDEMIPSYLSQAESLKHNIQFFNTGENPFTTFEHLLTDSFDKMRDGFFNGVEEEMNKYLTYENRKHAIQSTRYLSPSKHYLFHYKNNGNKTVHYTVENIEKVVYEDTVTISKDGLVQIYLSDDLNAGNEYILTMKENDVVIEEIVLHVLDVEPLMFTNKQVLHYFTPTIIDFDKSAKRKDFIVMNAGLEIIETIPYATTIQLNSQGNYPTGTHYMVFVVDDEIVLTQEFTIIKIKE